MYYIFFINEFCVSQATGKLPTIETNWIWILICANRSYNDQRISIYITRYGQKLILLLDNMLSGRPYQGLTNAVNEINYKSKAGIFIDITQKLPLHERWTCMRSFQFKCWFELIACSQLAHSSYNRCTFNIWSKFILFVLFCFWWFKFRRRT